MTVSLASQTPTLTVFDSRGVTLRTLSYNRASSGGDIDARIEHTLIPNDNRTTLHRDPRLFDAWQQNPAAPANLTKHLSVIGQTLKRDSTDSGSNVALYDIESRPVWTIDGRGTVTQWSYDVLGRPLTRSLQPSATPTARTASCYFYGDNDAQTPTPQESNLRGVCVRQYDGGGRLTTTHVAITGAVLLQTQTFLLNAEELPDWEGDESRWAELLETSSDADYATVITANALGQPVSQTDAAGNVQTWVYDLAGMAVRQNLTLSDNTTMTLLAGLNYSAAGQPLDENAGNGVVTTYGYEPQTQRLNTITALRSQDNTSLQALSYAYDPVGNLTSITDGTVDTRYFRNQATNGTRTFVYDALYQLISANGRENVGNTVQSNALPTPIAPLSSGDSAYSNYTRSYTYDRSRNLSTLSHSGESSDNCYTLTMVTDTQSNHSVPQDSTHNESPSTVNNYFDANGNLLQLQTDMSSTLADNLEWNTDNQLQTVVLVDRGSDISNSDREVYQYREGIRLRKQTRTRASSSGDSALWNVQEVRYLPGLELRNSYQETVAGNTTTPGLPSEELDVVLTQAGRSQIRVLHWETGKPDEIDNNQVRYGVDDNIGSLQLELDAQGQLISREEYYPYGGTAVWAANSEIEADYKTRRYSGKERDVTGLYYYGFRYYVPWLCRWLNADPAREVDGLNLFSMVLNNPTSHVDRQGLLTDAEERAGNLLLQRVRHSRAKKALDRMKEGAVFRRIPDLYKKSLDNTLSSIRETHPLTEMEADFLSALQGKKLYVTHASDGPVLNEAGDLVIYSRKRLLEKKVIFNYDHTNTNDIFELFNDDYVFFSLEVGEKKQKSSSRFGSTMYKVPYNHPAFKDSAMVLLDQLLLELPQTVRIDGISEIGKMKLEHRRYEKQNIMYQGRDEVILGLGHSIIKVARGLDQEDQAAILGAKSDREMNNVINGLFRPEIRVAGMVGLKGSNVITYPLKPSHI